MQICIMLGALVLFLLDVIKTLFSTRLKLRKTFVQIEEIGVDSWIIAILTGIFAGAVLALQSYIGFKRYGGQEFVGPVVALKVDVDYHSKLLSWISRHGQILVLRRGHERIIPLLAHGNRVVADIHLL